MGLSSALASVESQLGHCPNKMFLLGLQIDLRTVLME